MDIGALWASPKRTGAWVSGLGHAGLIGAVLFGGWFAAAPLPPAPAPDVSIISAEDFAALTRPDLAEQVVAPPASPSEPESAPEPEPELGPGPDIATDAPPGQPDIAVDTAPEAPPDPAPAPAEVPPAPSVSPQPGPPDLADAPPAPPAPPAPTPAPAVPTPLPPDDADVPAPAPRVAAEAAPPPPPEAETAPEVVLTPDDAPEPAPDTTPPEAPAAPEEAAPEIVTEAEEPATRSPDPEVALTASPRPRSRPARPPAPTVAAVPAEAPAESASPRTPGSTQSASSFNLDDRVEAALADVREAAPVQGEPAGPPMTEGEREAFRLAVRACWVVDVGSEAAGITVRIGFELTRDGRVVGDSLRMVTAGNGSDGAVRTAYEAGRRAILRCQGDGYDLPAEKYAQWRAVEVTFNPTEMRLR